MIEKCLRVVKDGGLISVLLGELKINYFPRLSKGLYMFDFDNIKPISAKEVK